MLSKQLKDILSDRLWNTAKTLISYFTKKGFSVHQFESIDTRNTYRLHLIFKKRYNEVGIEIRERCDIHTFFESFVAGCQARNVPLKIYFAVPERIEDEETIISHKILEEIKRLGVGLLTVREDTVVETISTISCHRRFVLEPGTSLGGHKAKILSIIDKFNLGDCLVSLRDLAEEVEDATVNLALKAARKGKINMVTADIENKRYTWEDLINCLSTDNYIGATQTKYFDRPLSNSMKSFKDVRNLSDHRKTAKEINQLEQIYLESMLQGTRLLRRLVAIQSRVR